MEENYAGFLRRFAAAVIDAFICLIATIPLTFLLMGVYVVVGYKRPLLIIFPFYAMLLAFTT